MLRFMRLSAPCIWLVPVALTGLECATWAALPTFTSAIRLQTPPNSTATFVTTSDSVSAASGVAGFFHVPPTSGSARWSADGSVTVLSNPPTAFGSDAYGINANGMVVGTAAMPGLSFGRAVRWGSDGSPILLGLAPGQTTTGGSQAFAINEAGVTVGWASQSTHLQAVRWAANGSATLLGEAPGYPARSTEPYNVNEAGQAVGRVMVNDSGNYYLAVRWEVDGSATLLGDLPGQTTTYSEAHGINSSGQAAGFIGRPDRQDFRATRWEANGSATLLGDLPGEVTNFSEAHGIVDGGLVAGEAVLQAPGGQVNRAVIWDSAGIAVRLQDLMGDGNTWSFARAIAIDANADMIRVVALGFKSNEPGGYYLLTAPIPEPSTACLLALTLVSFFRHRAVRR